MGDNQEFPASPAFGKQHSSTKQSLEAFQDILTKQLLPDGISIKKLSDNVELLKSIQDPNYGLLDGEIDALLKNKP